MKCETCEPLSKFCCLVFLVEFSEQPTDLRKSECIYEASVYFHDLNNSERLYDYRHHFSQSDRSSSAGLL